MTLNRPPEQPRLAMLWSHRIDLDHPGALADLTELQHMARGPQPVEINIGRTLIADVHDPEAFLHALAAASQTHGHVLHLIGAPGYVRAWWRAIHQTSQASGGRPELQILDGGQP